MPREIEVTDEPSRLDLFGGYPVDDEGVPARRTHLVNAGHLASLLRDRVRSDSLHPSTGNGRRASPFDHAAPRGSNIVVGSGGASDGEMLHRLANGIRIEELVGGSVDPASGEFRLRFAAAQSIQRGRPGQSLGPGVVHGDILDALGQIDPLLGVRVKPCRQLAWCAREGKVLPIGGEAPAMIVRRLQVAPGEPLGRILARTAAPPALGARRGSMGDLRETRGRARSPGFAEAPRGIGSPRRRIRGALGGGNLLPFRLGLFGSASPRGDRGSRPPERGVARHAGEPARRPIRGRLGDARDSRARPVRRALPAPRFRVEGQRPADVADGGGRLRLRTARKRRGLSGGPQPLFRVRQRARRRRPREQAHERRHRLPRGVAGSPDLEKIAQSLADRCLIPLRGSGSPFPRGELLLDPSVSALLLSATLPLFCGDENRLLLSRKYLDRAGRFAAPAVSIIDDASREYPFDGEGIPVRRNTVVENGIFRRRLHDLGSAARTGEEPTGNAIRGSFRFPPRPGSARFLLLSRAAESPVDLLRRVTRGIYATAACAPLRVDLENDQFRMEVEGWALQAGRAKAPVAAAVVRGRLSEFWRTLSGVGDDLRWFPLSTTTGAPTLLLPRIAFS